MREDWVCEAVAAMVGEANSWTLCLDRTYWMVGRVHVNFLVMTPKQIKQKWAPVVLPDLR